jgi:hypothetical protein
MEISNSADKFSKNKEKWKLHNIFRNIDKTKKTIINPFVFINVLRKYVKQYFWNLNNTDRESS